MIKGSMDNDYAVSETLWSIVILDKALYGPRSCWIRATMFHGYAGSAALWTMITMAQVTMVMLYQGFYGP